VSTIKSGLSTKKNTKISHETINNKQRKTSNKKSKRFTNDSITSYINLPTNGAGKQDKTNQQMFISCFDLLAEQMAVLMAATLPQNNPQRPCGWIWRPNMRPMCNALVGEDHHQAQYAQTTEPPTMMGPAPSLDEEIHSDPGC